MPIPFEVSWTHPERVRQQRHYARAALRACAVRCGAPPEGWEQSADGAPLPNHGRHWSIAHKRGMAAAVVADQPVGIDVELVQLRRKDLWSEVAERREWALMPTCDWPSFYRLWTAKEAVLKANGVGLSRLDGCRLSRGPRDRRMILTFEGQSYCVEHFELDDHLAAVTCTERPVNWTVINPHEL